MPVTRLIFKNSPWYNDQEMKSHLNVSNLLFYSMEGAVFAYLYAKRIFRNSAMVQEQSRHESFSILKWISKNKLHAVPVIWIGGCAASFAFTGLMSLGMREIHRQQHPQRMLSGKHIAQDAFIAGFIGMMPWINSIENLLPMKSPHPAMKLLRRTSRCISWGLFWMTCTILYQWIRMQYVMRLIRKRAETDERLEQLPLHLQKSYTQQLQAWWGENKPTWWLDGNLDAMERAKKKEAVDRVVGLHMEAIQELKEERDQLLQQHRGNSRDRL